MRKIYYITTLLACLTCFWACEKDDTNPVYHQPDSFVLNTPGYASIVTDLQKSTSLALTCSQPDYGFTAATTYSIQVSINDTWKAETELSPATYEELTTTFTTAKLSAPAIDVARIIVKLSGWTEAEELSGEPMDIFIRLKASVSTLLPPVYSNSVKIKVLPFFIKLTDALPATYFLVGACIGNGTWNNSPADIGLSLIPLSLIPNQEYDKVSGKGVFTYTGFFPADKGFKLIGVPGSWDEQWGQIDGVYVHNDSGSKDITVPADGYYTITLNSLKDELTIEPFSNLTTAFHAMQLVGTFEGWGGTPVEMTKTGGDNSNVWYADVTFSDDAGDGEGCKFRTDASWGNNWGGDNFPYSVAVSGGANILYTTGTYRVIFNDWDKCYYFFIKE
jgi:hypothetical protein